jgi:hypothetical protein
LREAGLTQLTRVVIKKFNKKYLFIALPTCQLLFSIPYVIKLPENWAYFSDPSYAYLMNGLAVLEGYSPNIIQHPGISMQLYVGLVILIITLFQGQNDLVSSILQNPEKYLHLLAFTNLFIFVSVFTIFSRIFQKHFGLVPVLVFQLSLIASFNLFLPWIFLAMPEFLVLISAFICLSLILTNLFGKSLNFNLNRYSCTLGLVMALGIMSKVIFAPIVLLTLIVIDKKSARKVFGFFVVFVVLQLLLVPNRINELLKFFWGSSKSLNRYDATSGYDLNIFITNYGLVFEHLKSQLGIMVIIYMILLITFFAFLAFKKIKLVPNRVYVGLILATLAVLLTGYKVSTSRDFILVGFLLPITLALACYEIRESKISKMIYALIIIILVQTTYWNLELSRHTLLKNISTSEQAKNDSLAVESKVKNSWLIGQYGVLSKNAAIQFGNNWAGSHFSKEIAAKYARQVEFNIWDSNFYYNNPNSGLTNLKCEDVQSLINNADLYAILLNYNLDSRMSSLDTIRFSSKAKMNFSEKWKYEKYTLFKIEEIQCTE